MKLLSVSLSLRKESYNKKLLQIATECAKSTSADIEHLDLADYEMPAYNGDEQDQGFPKAAEQLRAKIDACQGLIIASPEYNFSYPGHFKNSFDWISRFVPMPWARKAVLFLSASPSMVGANRALWHLRVPFEACGAFVFPDMFSVSTAHQAFDEKNQLKDPVMAKRLQDTVLSFLRFTEHLKY